VGNTYGPQSAGNYQPLKFCG